MDTRPDASRATKFTYSLSCFGTELVHRCLGVFGTVFTSFFFGGGGGGGGEMVHFEAACPRK